MVTMNVSGYEAHCEGRVNIDTHDKSFMRDI